MAVLYVALALIIVITNITAVPGAIATIVKTAFNGSVQLICRRYTQHSDEEIDAYIQRYFAQTGVVRVDLESISAKANI